MPRYQSKHWGHSGKLNKHPCPGEISSLSKTIRQLKNIEHRITVTGKEKNSRKACLGLGLVPFRGPARAPWGQAERQLAEGAHAQGRGIGSSVPRRPPPNNKAWKHFPPVPPIPACGRSEVLLPQSCTAVPGDSSSHAPGVGLRAWAPPAYAPTS